LYIPGTIKPFQFVEPEPENAPEPLRQFEFEPNIPEHQPRPLPQTGGPQRTVQVVQTSPFIIQNIVTTSTTSGTIRVFNQGKEIITTHKAEQSKPESKPAPNQSPNY
jgi:hypothetical protein